MNENKYIKKDLLRSLVLSLVLIAAIIVIYYL